jgi:hypothetical protein
VPERVRHKVRQERVHRGHRFAAGSRTIQDPRAVRHQHPLHPHRDLLPTCVTSTAEGGEQLTMFHSSPKSPTTATGSERNAGAPDAHPRPHQRPAPTIGRRTGRPHPRAPDGLLNLAAAAALPGGPRPLGPGRPVCDRGCGFVPYGWRWRAALCAVPGSIAGGLGWRSDRVSLHGLVGHFTRVTRGAWTIGLCVLRSANSRIIWRRG